MKYLMSLLICSSLAIFFPFAYIKIWGFCNKFLKNKIVKAIFIGSITPFFSFAFAVNFVFSFLYVTGLASQPENGAGALTAVLFFCGIPASIFLGIIIVIFILMENTAFKDEVIRSLKKDARNFFNGSHSKKKK